jgi:hypothetical protein
MLRQTVSLLCGVLLVSACSPSNFCLNSGRALSDEELISRVVGDENVYANCCRVNRGKSTSIEAYLKVKPEDETRKKYPLLTYYETHFEINACGEVKERYGMHVKADERPCWVRGEKISSTSDLELIRKALVVASDRLGQKSTADSIQRFISKRPDCCSVQRDVPDGTGHVYSAQVAIRYPHDVKSTDDGKIPEHLLVSFNACADWASTSIPSTWSSIKAPWAME